MGTIRKTVDLDFPRALVWEAISTSEGLSAWLMPNDFVLRDGHAFTLQTDPAPGFDGTVRCTVLSYEIERMVSFSWRGGGLDTIVTIALEDSASGTLLTLSHEGFSLRQLPVRAILFLGWRKLLGRKLPAYLVSTEVPVHGA